MQRPTRVPAIRLKSRQPVCAARDALYERPRTDGLLVETFFNCRVKLATVCPETALMYAVLEDAFLCYQKRFHGHARFPQRTRAVEDWFFSDDSRRLFSFLSVCHVLGLEPQYIRNKLRRWEHSNWTKP